MITKKYKKLISYIQCNLDDISSVEFNNFLIECDNMAKLAKEAAEILEEVRTGEDFECVCWDKAAEIKGLLGIKD